MGQTEKVPSTSIAWPVAVGVVLLVILAASGIAIMTSTPTELVTCESADGSCANSEPDAVHRASPDVDRSPVVLRPQPPDPEILPSDYGVSQAATGFRGVVQDTYGRPVSGVEIRPRGSSFVLARTDGNGEFFYRASPKTATVLYLSKPDYRVTTLHLRAPANLEVDEPWSQVITMATIGETYGVDGYVVSQYGLAIGDAQAYLESRRVRTRYTAPVADNGYYQFPAVEPGDDYQLRISAAPDLKTIRLGPLEISGPTTLEYLMMEPLRTANVSIFVQDTTGYPLANQDLVVDIASNTSLRKRVTTNDAGVFTLEQIPEGQLSISTKGFPRLEVNGIRFSAQHDTELAVKLNATP